jgi:hypothetical protein
MMNLHHRLRMRPLMMTVTMIRPCWSLVVPPLSSPPPPHTPAGRAAIGPTRYTVLWYGNRKNVLVCVDMVSTHHSSCWLYIIWLRNEGTKKKIQKSVVDQKMARPPGDRPFLHGPAITDRTNDVSNSPLPVPESFLETWSWALRPTIRQRCTSWSSSSWSLLLQLLRLVHNSSAP